MLRSFQRSRTGAERGAAVVEFAFVLPLFLMLALGVVDFGYLINRGTLVNNAAREGAREAIFGSDSAAIEARVRQVTESLDQADLTVTVTCMTPGGSLCPGFDYDSEWEPGGSVIVTVDYQHEYISP